MSKPRLGLESPFEKLSGKLLLVNKYRPWLLIIIVSIALTIFWINADKLWSNYYLFRARRLISKMSSDTPRETNSNGLDWLFPTTTDQDILIEVRDIIPRLLSVSDLDPNNARIHQILGRLFVVNGETEKAIIEFEKYVYLRPKNPLGHLELGFLYEMINDVDSASASWSAAGITEDDFIEAAEQIIKKGNFQLALSWYHRALIMNPMSGDIWYRIGNLHVELSEWNEARAAFTTAIKLSPQDLRPYLALGEMYAEHTAEYEEALKTYTEVLRMDPFSIRAYVGKSSVLRNLNRMEDAIEVATLAVEISEQVTENGDVIDPWELVWPKYQLGDHYLSVGEFEKAAQMFTEAIAEDNSGRWTVWSLLGLGRVKYLEQDYAGSISMFQGVLDRTESSSFRIPALVGIGLNYREMGNYDKAIKYIQQAVDVEPTNGWTRRNLAETYKLDGDNQNAIEEYRRLLALDPENEYAKEQILLLESGPLK